MPFAVGLTLRLLALALPCAVVVSFVVAVQTSCLSNRNFNICNKPYFAVSLVSVAVVSMEIIAKQRQK